MGTGVVFAAAAGASFALIGIAYRLGQSRGVTPVRIAPVMALAGATFFCLKAGGLASTPIWIWGIGAATGVGQYLLLGLLRCALARGPLSPVWCAVSLNFVGATIYARLVLAETLTWMQLAGLGAGIGCVLVAGRCAHAPDAQPAARAGGAGAYLAVLVGVFVLNSMPAIVVKHLAEATPGSGPSHLQAHGDALYVALYVALLASSLAEAVVRTPHAPPSGTLLALGALAATGSIAGMACLAACAAEDASVVFTVSSTVSIGVAGLVSVAAFGERPGLAWGGMLALGTAAVALVSLS